MVHGALQRYMGGSQSVNSFNINIWLCPSDDPNIRRSDASPKYPFSYTMNFILNDHLADVNGDAAAYLNGQAPKMSRVRHPSDTIMALEEASMTMNDGFTSLVGGFSSAVSNGSYNYSQLIPMDSGGDLLSVRHDSQVHMPDTTYIAAKDAIANSPNPLWNIPNARGRGNAVFCDGHAEWVTREFAERPDLRHWDPTH